jgi:TRAP-type uncharacterized transport system substrate-binding protein
MSLWRYVVIVVRDELKAVAEQARESKLLLAAFLACLLGIVVYLDPFPDRKVNFATAYAGSDWHQFGEMAVRYLGTKGLGGSVVVTTGAAENVDRLVDPADPVNAAFAYGMAFTDAQRKEVVSLGSISYDPIWIFYRKDRIATLDDLDALTRLRVGLGPPRSGTYAITRQLLAEYGIDLARDGNFVPETFPEGARNFLAGRLDVLVMVASVQDPLVQELMRTEGIELHSFANAAGFEKRYNSLEKLVLPAGSMRVYPPLPTRDVSLIATTTSLVVKKSMHPDLQLALLMTIKQMNRSSVRLFFAGRNEFPSYVDPLVPLSPVASRFYDYGPPAVMRHLPFWIAGFVDRAWVLLLGLVAVFYPLSKLNLQIRKLRYVVHERPHWEELIEIEERVVGGPLTDEEKVALGKRLDDIHRHAFRAKVPVGEETDHFEFLHAVELLRDKIEKR